ncbi:transcriptional regulator, LysR family [Anaeromyxobacter sp. K]|uniref:LysR family transcriptional regulator n=1 Tax=Anaeromyxobacter sp. (strain K) TaxID=447217 RepID=UPI00015F9416|nr:LysR family transcriptional regulator [Anaeromyxobacter sp. K]ACG74808.1 transcriptional regulator, LysR family [Anaeromyxobacter sp. K]
MAHGDGNRLYEMEAFAAVAELGGFSAAGRALGKTPSALNKLVARLEARLGARLLTRTTRAVRLTAEGEAFHQRALRILAEVEEAEGEARGGAPRGRVRVNANLPFGVHCLLPVVPSFLEANPGVTLDLVLTDEVVDLVERRADVAIRVGPLRASGLLARKLGESPVAVVASPDYLARRGTPHTPADLGAHERIGFTFPRTLQDWPFRQGGEEVRVPVRGAVRAGDGETARRLALAGAGLARLALFQVTADLEAGRLVRVLEAFEPGDALEIHALFLGPAASVPARVRAFVEFLASAHRSGRGAGARAGRSREGASAR